MLNRNKISTQTKILCIIGHPIAHSMSPLMHNIILQDLNLDYLYVAFDIEPSRLEDAIRAMKALKIKGMNITLPYKEKAIPYLDKIDPLAEKIGAVNTVKLKDNLLIGKNTDAEGAILALQDSGVDFNGRNVVLLGSGGAAKAVSYAIINNINNLTILNRTEKNAIKLKDRLIKSSNASIEAKKLNERNLMIEIKKADILINATPIGMYPYQNESPVPEKLIHEELTIFDLIYNPLETQIIKDAKKKGCKTLNGLDMLIYQGSLALKWWIGIEPNKILLKNKLMDILKEKNDE
jgi:shikimate dehydrogenase